MPMFRLRPDVSFLRRLVVLAIRVVIALPLPAAKQTDRTVTVCDPSGRRRLVFDRR